ncbi:ATP-binding protein [Salinarchaeum laminariae]|uniref:ATP-binding protein n=1 Tax=Salinarchaeum laminariae TaxID=869888 RepID=UPI0020BF8048|nr:ATP-binding protein [Salinarchaeum laminariae]
MSTSTRQFDLNMEEVLEAWGPADAAREIIANAMDEAALTGTDDPDIFSDDGSWHIRDYGRGFRYEHLTQAEDDEKLDNPDKVIGKFGVGVKDAIATCHRHGIVITIHSPHNTFTVKEAPKHGFEEIETLHVEIHSPEKDIEGTEVVLDGITDEDIEAAKQNFIEYTDAELLEQTRFGDVYEVPRNEDASVFVSGLRVASEPNFLFSYNITNTTKKINDALNRERSNVGRTAYSTRVKKILQECESETVASRLVDDLNEFVTGETHDELDWKPVQVHAVKILNAERDVVVATHDEQNLSQNLFDNARSDGYEIVTIPDRIKPDIEDATDVKGDQIRGAEEYREEFRDSFSYEFLDEEDLTDEELEMWELRHDIFSWVALPDEEWEAKISESLRTTDPSRMVTCEREDKQIIFHREILAYDKKNFLRDLLDIVAFVHGGEVLHRAMLSEIAGAVSAELIGAAGQADSNPVFPGEQLESELDE